MTALAAASRFVVSPRLYALRASLGVPIDEVPVTDPTRIAFNQLHHLSTAAMAVEILCALVLVALFPAVVEAKVAPQAAGAPG